MIDLSWDLFQQGQLKDLQQARHAHVEREQAQDDKTYALEARLHELEQRHEQLKLVTLALWSLLRNHSGLLESDLRKYVEKIDHLDGKHDGKALLPHEKITCPGCSRSIIGTARVCAYCGAPVRRKNVFGAA